MGEVLPDALVPGTGGSVSSGDLRGLPRVPFMGVGDVFLVFFSGYSFFIPRFFLSFVFLFIYI